MTATTLTAWSAQLSALTNNAALAIGSWLDALDELLTPGADESADTGSPDGYDGLSTRGTPDRLLLSEWLLAEEEPDEFLRRAASGELTHLAPAYRRRERRARMLVLADSGPACWGPPRLAQLAIILVLHRQAESRGLPLHFAMAGGPAGRWTAGAPESLLAAWLRGRHRNPARPGDLAAWRSALTDEDDVWLLTAGDADAPGMRTVSISESAWGAGGVAELTVACGGRRVVLPMPPADRALAMLRGHAFRATVTPATTAPAATGHPIRSPMFPDHSSRLFGRGATDDVLIMVTLPDGRPRRHGLPGPIRAAGVSGHRAAVLFHQANGLVLRVIGEAAPWPGVARWSDRDLPDLGPDSDGPLWPLRVGSDHALVRIGDAWWRLGADGRAEWTDLVAVGSAHRPRTATSAPPDGTYALVDAHNQLLRSPDGIVWTAPDGTVLRVPDRDEIVGATMAGGRVALLTVSPGGLILRLVEGRGVRTLTRWSPVSGVPAAHPSRPWIAVNRPDGDLVVVDTDTDLVVRRMRAGT
jgi:hypothetical protein